jgi:hypothetical protein
MKKPWLLVLFFSVVFTLSNLPLGHDAQGGQKTVQVPANKVLTDAKMFVQAGDRLSIQATGTWTVKPKEGVYCGPDGEPGTSAPAGYKLPGAPIGALVAAVAGKVYLVGSSTEVTIGKSGPLQFTANTEKKLSAYVGNKGSLTVQIDTLKAAAAGVDGRYEITFKEDQVMVVTGQNKKKLISLNELKNQKVKTDTGQDIQLPDNTAETLRDLPKVIDLEVKKLNVFIRDAKKPDDPPLKGLYNPNKKEFAIHVEGKAKQIVGACYFLYAETIAGKLVSDKLDGSINLTLSLFCGGGGKGKGKAVIVSLPFVGKRVP